MNEFELVFGEDELVDGLLNDVDELLADADTDDDDDVDVGLLSDEDVVFGFGSDRRRFGLLLLLLLLFDCCADRDKPHALYNKKKKKMNLIQNSQTVENTYDRNTASRNISW